MPWVQGEFIVTKFERDRDIELRRLYTLWLHARGTPEEAQRRQEFRLYVLEAYIEGSQP